MHESWSHCYCSCRWCQRMRLWWTHHLQRRRRRQQLRKRRWIWMMKIWNHLSCWPEWPFFVVAWLMMVERGRLQKLKLLQQDIMICYDVQGSSRYATWTSVKVFHVVLNQECQFLWCYYPESLLWQKGKSLNEKGRKAKLRVVSRTRTTMLLLFLALFKEG